MGTLKRGNLQGIIDQIRDLRGSGAVEQDYLVIPNLLTKLEQDVRDAHRIDADEYNSSEEIKNVQSLGFFALTGVTEEEFQQQASSCVNDARAAFEEVKEKCARAVDALDVPERLRADAEAWGEIENETIELSETIPRLAQVEGWSGPAAEQYALMTGVQAQACLEYQGFARVIRENMELFVKLNMAVLQNVAGFLTTAHGDNVRDIKLQVGGAMHYFKRSQKVAANLRLLAGSLDRCYEVIDGPLAGAAERFRSSAEGAVLLRKEWPSGAVLAGVQAGDTTGSKVKIDEMGSAGRLGRSEAVEGIQR